MLLDAPLFCTVVRLRCHERFAAKHIEQMQIVHKNRWKWKAQYTEQAAYNALEVLTDVGYDDNKWDVLESTVVLGDTSVNAPPWGTALLVLFGNLHCAVIVASTFIHSHHELHGGFEAMCLPHNASFSLCEMAGNDALAGVDTRLFYIRLNLDALQRFAKV